MGLSEIGKRLVGSVSVLYILKNPRYSGYWDWGKLMVDTMRR